ncbi:phage tail protein [Cohnella faecalis]|uniref:Phage tail protein n=1 Tax=Cohnella faecalis TaxID=2315694 RepID=A0A398CD85_9BACL|nr:tail fiber protein [Cohnella faecalis]RIE00670.1 phage tail protein [Cohnella faecalis]
MDPYVGEIRIFAGKYAPNGWALCDGSLLPVQSNQALFSILGKTYGGDGRTTFGVPDLRGTAPMHQGTGPGLTPRPYATSGGQNTVTLLESQIPNHTHVPLIQTTASQSSAAQAIWATSPGSSKTARKIYSNNVDTPMNPMAISPTGGNQAHNNLQPYLTMNFIISLEGVYPLKP